MRAFRFNSISFFLFDRFCQQADETDGSSHPVKCMEKEEKDGKRKVEGMKIVLIFNCRDGHKNCGGKIKSEEKNGEYPRQKTEQDCSCHCHNKCKGHNMIKRKTSRTDFFGSAHPVAVGIFLFEHFGETAPGVLV